MSLNYWNLSEDKTEFTTDEIIEIALNMSDNEDISFATKLTSIIMLDVTMTNKSDKLVDVILWFDTDNTNEIEPVEIEITIAGLELNPKIEDVIALFKLNNSMWTISNHGTFIK